MADKEQKACCAGIICCLLATVLCIIQFQTMHKVNLNNVALKQSILNKKITEDEIYFEGRYYYLPYHNALLLTPSRQISRGIYEQIYKL